MAWKKQKNIDSFPYYRQNYHFPPTRSQNNSILRCAYSNRVPYLENEPDVVIERNEFYCVETGILPSKDEKITEKPILIKNTDEDIDRTPLLPVFYHKMESQANGCCFRKIRLGSQRNENLSAHQIFRNGELETLIPIIEKDPPQSVDGSNQSVGNPGEKDKSEFSLSEVVRSYYNRIACDEQVTSAISNDFKTLYLSLDPANQKSELLLFIIRYILEHSERMENGEVLIKFIKQVPIIEPEVITIACKEIGWNKEKFDSKPGSSISADAFVQVFFIFLVSEESIEQYAVPFIQQVFSSIDKFAGSIIDKIFGQLFGQKSELLNVLEKKYPSDLRGDYQAYIQKVNHKPFTARVKDRLNQKESRTPNK